MRYHSYPYNPHPHNYANTNANTHIDTYPNVDADTYQHTETDCNPKATNVAGFGG